MKVEFKGGRELEAAMKALGNGVAADRNLARRALDRAAVPIRDEWVRRVDRDQGDLARSIQIGGREQTKASARFRRGAGGDIVERYVGIDAGADDRGRLAAGKGSPGYAYIEEFGRDGHPANPAGRSAFETKKLDAMNLLAETLGDEIAKTAARVARKKAKG